MKEAQMGPALAGVSANKGWAQSSFVLGKLPLSRKLLSCRFPFDLQLLSGVWVRGEVDLADPSHETGCYQGQQWRPAARCRRDFCARESATCGLCHFPIRQGSDAFNSQLVGRANTQRTCFCYKARHTERQCGLVLLPREERCSLWHLRLPHRY